mmetsp:Transcript_10768/g.27951  ORF Transcript_10768/g.27951 Transcript_10768/m.27951 type:complete len:222 (-) Transcript_10768:762-1427(-)
MNAVAMPLRPARPVRPMRCVYASTEGARSYWITCSTPSMSMPRPTTSVATSTSAWRRLNVSSAVSRWSCDLPPWMVAVGHPARSSVLASVFAVFFWLTKTITGGGGPVSSSSSSLSSFAFSLTNAMCCVMFSLVDDGSPMYTYAGSRMYARAIFSSACGIVAENMNVWRPTRAPSPSPSDDPAGASLGGGAGASAGMRSRISLSCDSKPRSIIRSASSSTR